MNSSLITNDGTITFTHENRAFTVTTTHPNYHKILTAIKGRKFKVAQRLSESSAVKMAVQKLSNRVTVDGGQILFDGKPVGGVVVDRILKFVREGLPYKPLVKFLENIQANPSARSVEELYGFLEHRGMPITDDGCFIAYKGIGQDWKDLYTHTIDNSIGRTVEFPRNKVDDDCQHTCSFGLHVGSHAYASDYGRNGRLVLVKVNPADAVSVPVDHDAQKLRVMKYRVVGEAEPLPLTSETFGDVTPNDDDCDNAESFCEDCGEEDCCC